MSTAEIEDYLSDCNIPENQIPELALDIQGHLDPTPMYAQIDELLRKFAYDADYERTIRN